MSNHNTKIFKLYETNLLNISPLGIKNISDNNIKYLLIYLWNVIGENTSQIFIQINNLKVSNINDNVITFDLLDNSDITHINLIEEQIDFVELIRQNTNYKEQLSRLFQEKYGEYPIYEMISMEELPGGKEFTMGVLNPAGVCLAKATHSIKKKAEQQAACITIDQWEEKIKAEDEYPCGIRSLQHIYKL